MGDEAEAFQGCSVCHDLMLLDLYVDTSAIGALVASLLNVMRDGRCQLSIRPGECKTSSVRLSRYIVEMLLS